MMDMDDACRCMSIIRGSFVENYRHPAPRRGGPWVHFAGIYFDSVGTAGSAGEFAEATDDCENTIHRAIFAGKWPWKSVLDHAYS